MRSSSSVTIGHRLGPLGRIVAEHLEVPAGDRDRRAQLVGDVVEEPPLGAEALVEPVDHVVERGAELGQLVVTLDGDARREVRLGDPPRRARSARAPAAAPGRRATRPARGRDARTASPASVIDPHDVVDLALVVGREAGDDEDPADAASSASSGTASERTSPTSPTRRGVVVGSACATRPAGEELRVVEQLAATRCVALERPAVDDRVERLVVGRHVAAQERVEDRRARRRRTAAPVAGSTPPASRRSSSTSWACSCSISRSTRASWTWRVTSDRDDRQADRHQHEVADDDPDPDARRGPRRHAPTTSVITVSAVVAVAVVAAVVVVVIPVIIVATRRHRPDRRHRRPAAERRRRRCAAGGSGGSRRRWRSRRHRRGRGRGRASWARSCVVVVVRGRRRHGRGGWCPARSGGPAAAPPGTRSSTATARPATPATTSGEDSEDTTVGRMTRRQCERRCPAEQDESQMRVLSSSAHRSLTPSRPFFTLSPTEIPARASLPGGWLISCALAASIVRLPCVCCPFSSLRALLQRALVSLG